MIEIPPEVTIKSTIKPGTVYYFTQETFQSNKPHYFIVINHDPINDDVIMMVCASSQIDKVLRRNKDNRKTIVVIEESQYECFKVKSAIDCNRVITKSINQIIKKLDAGQMKTKADIDIKLVNKMRGAVLQSRQVERKIKNMLIIPLKE